MKKLLTLLFAALALAVSPVWCAERPKLVVAVVVDQFRYDYLIRFRSEYKAGFARMYKEGAVFTDAHHNHFPTVTAIGHSTFLSGAPPSMSGIVGNAWYDRETNGEVTSVSDPRVRLLGGNRETEGESPSKMLVSTIGDELKMSGRGTKVIGISIKDRSAILPSGHMADAAYWFDAASGDWVSSSYYFKDLPRWVKEYNQSRPADKFLGEEWKPSAPFLGAPATFGTLDATPGPSFYASLEATPYGNELVEQFTERAIDAEELGRHSGVDLLTVSYSANDYVGHAFGPDSARVHDMCLRTDEVLGRLLNYLDRKIGPGNTLLVMIADHGVSPVPEVNQERKMPGGRIPRQLVLQTIQSALVAAYGQGQWVLSMPEILPYLNYSLIQDKKLDRAEVEKTAADAVLALPHIFRVYTGEDILTGNVQRDSISETIANGYYQKRSGDLLIIPDPYYLFEAHGTSHGTPFNYDTHVPLIFMGPGVRPGIYNGRVVMNDIAPTLSAMLDIEEPSGSIGRALTEMIEH